MTRCVATLKEPNPSLCVSYRTSTTVLVLYVALAKLMLKKGYGNEYTSVLKCANYN